MFEEVTPMCKLHGETQVGGCQKYHFEMDNVGVWKRGFVSSIYSSVFLSAKLTVGAPSQRSYLFIITAIGEMVLSRQ